MLATTPELSARDVHRLALLLEGRCSGCAERLPGGVALRGGDCPRCSTPAQLDASARGALNDWYASRASTRMWMAVGAVGVGSFVTGMLPLAASLLTLAALAWIRWTIIVPGTRLLAPGRRIVSQWTLRLAGGAFAALGLIVIEFLTLLSFLGMPAKALIAAAQVGFGAWLARTYLSWQTRREAEGRRVAFWEWAFVIVAACTLVATCAALVVAAVWLEQKIQQLLSELNGGTLS